MEIAVFGGSFNPPTRAHEAIMAACLADPRNDEVWVMPSGERDDKPGLSQDELRLCMLGLVKQERFKNDPRLVITDFELQLPRPSHTDSTVDALERAYPDHTFRYIFGADAYYDMPNWPGRRCLQRDLNLLIINREGYALPAETEQLHVLRPEADPVTSVSSTRVRAAVAAGEAITAYVCQTVEQFIGQQKLYVA